MMSVVLVATNTAPVTAIIYTNVTVSPAKTTYMPAGTDAAQSSSGAMRSMTTNSLRTSYLSSPQTRTGC